MKQNHHRSVRGAFAVTMGLLLLQHQPAFAGWTGLINGLGVGWASVNVRSATSVTNTVKTLNNLSLPSAAMSPTTGYKTNAALPTGASTNTYSRIKGLSGGVWQAASKAAIGDGTDNPELQSRIRITPADCASVTFDSFINESQEQFNAKGNSGTITVNATATAGTALWLRGFEFTGSMADIPEDDLATVENESIEYLKVNGVLKFENLIAGPFSFGGTNGGNCPLLIPFSLTSSNLEHLVFASDAVALSLPLLVICPPDVVVSCDQSFTYPPVQFAGCGDINITFNPPRPASGTFAPGTFPVGVTPVTVTATDSDGHTTNCTFTVTITDTVPPVAPALPTLVGEASVTVPQPPTTTDNCGGAVTASTTDPLFYNTQGTFTVRWNFDDGHGNTNTANQTVIVKDVTPPVAPVVTAVTGLCSVTVTAPTAVDAIAGSIVGTTTDPLTYTAQGVYTVRWTFNDGNGNSSTANQTIVVKDTIKPVAPVLPVLTGDCGSSVTLVPPTATDNCAGAVVGTTSSPLTITTPGTNQVIWTFNDGNGNITTATQRVVIVGVEFHGFYSPIGKTGGTCSGPVMTANLGNNIPVKFDTTCNCNSYLGGRPSLSIERSSQPSQPCGPLVSVGGGNFTVVGNEWHFNWDTSGQVKGTYKLTATLQDGTKQFVWIKLK